MGIPEYDQQGYPIPYDDAEIENQHSLLRYIDFIRHFDKGKFSSGAFSTSSETNAGPNPGMSTDWKESIETSGRNIFYRVKSEEVVAEVKVQFLRLINDKVKVGQTPDNGNNNPHHVDVWGVKSQGNRRKIRDNATFHFMQKITGS